ncbi:unnamed protein product [Porites lobata]|uniref:G-protein coupled receptors family 1 profile domain-containing protein n=1 Tax=Porites lobata TaxID=104759 RepID=A0ABN8QL83_9CNID|nr:unnamed protein product [Porites lobata]
MAVLLYCYGSLVRGLYFTNTFCQEIDTERRAEKRKLVITFIFSCFNPIIYAFRSTSFKEGLKPTILCCNSC